MSLCHRASSGVDGDTPSCMVAPPRAGWDSHKNLAISAEDRDPVELSDRATAHFHEENRAAPKLNQIRRRGGEADGYDRMPELPQSAADRHSYSGYYFPQNGSFVGDKDRHESIRKRDSILRQIGREMHAAPNVAELVVTHRKAVKIPIPDDSEEVYGVVSEIMTQPGGVENSKLASYLNTYCEQVGPEHVYLMVQVTSRDDKGHVTKRWRRLGSDGRPRHTKLADDSRAQTCGRGATRRSCRPGPCTTPAMSASIA